MANPVKHNREIAIDKATQLFWSKGFHGTSMRNLQDAIDMRPGSIYASFGSKEGLFQESLNHYAQSSMTRLDNCLQETGSPIEAIKEFITETILNKQKPSPSSMCMLVKTIAELTEDQAELLTQAKTLLNKIETAIADLLEQAQQQGELSASKNPSRLARLLQMQLVGMGVYLRSNSINNVNVNVNANAMELINDAFSCLE
ncbi:TetR/AcrR family transcriptional regulator [Marinicellulosiphila megalodicopiae]|uniref:TetR/AcrR family transcriptional regulator n=1 Tax=Marinicellulosiphila megalodicopiae TaxID=2724896 RepID=UPI003BAEC7C7